MNCVCCGRFLSKVDALPFGGAAAHFACVADAQLSGRPRGRVVVMVRRKGPAFASVPANNNSQGGS